MYQFAHISDIHLAPLPQPSFRQLIGKRLTGYINWKKKRAHEMENTTLPTLMAHLQNKKPSHLLISGDLVNLSLDAEFAQAREWIASLGTSRDVSLTLGNHDAYVCGAFDKACTAFAPWIKNDEPQAWKTAFPFLRMRDEVAFIAASSALATPPFFAAGYFDTEQARHLGELLDQAKQEKRFRVVMIHHPPLYHATHWHKKLWGIKRFQNVIARHGAELILHGHTHLPTLSEIKTPSGAVPVISVASASQAFGGKKPPANYNWFQISSDESHWQCQVERYTTLDTQNNIGKTEELHFSLPK